MKILFDMVDFQIGGIQKVNSLIANHYVALGHEVHFIAPQIGDPATYELDDKIKIFWYSSENIHLKMKELKVHLKEHTYDVYFSGLQSKLRFVAVLSKVPRIIHILHNTYTYNIRERVIERLLCLKTEYVSVSNAVADHTATVLPVSRNKIKTIYNSVNVERFSLKEDFTYGDTIKLCSVGRLVYQKGYDILLRIVAECKNRQLPISLTIIGDGLERKNLEKMVDELCIGSLVTFAGEHKDVAPILKEFHCFVSALRYGGFEIVLAEAMASGLPVIAFDVGPVKEVIGGKCCGLLAENNNINDFVDKIDYLISHHDEIEMRGRNSREKVLKQFSETIMKNNYEKLLIETGSNE